MAAHGAEVDEVASQLLEADFEALVRSVGEAESLEEALAADAAAAQQWLRGRLKSFNEKMGCGFVECAEAHAQFGCDVLLPGTAAKTKRVGAQVLFLLDQDAAGRPIVSEMRLADTSENTQGSARGGGQSQGPSAQDLAYEQFVKALAEEDSGAAGEGDGGALANWTDAAEGDQAEDAGDRYVGEVKSFDLIAGRGFIECERAKAAFGKDVYVHKSVLGQAGGKVGDVVQFKIHVNSQGLPQASSPMTVLQSRMLAEQMGTVKSFSEKTGYGFISCEETFAQHGRDVYLPSKVARGLYVGQEVFFNVGINNGMPVATEAFPAKVEADKGGKGKARPRQLIGGKGGRDGGAKGKGGDAWGCGDEAAWGPGGTGCWGCKGADAWGGCTGKGPDAWGGCMGKGPDAWGGCMGKGPDAWGGCMGKGPEAWGGCMGKGPDAWGGCKGKGPDAWGGCMGKGPDAWGGCMGKGPDAWGGCKGKGPDAWGGCKGAWGGGCGPWGAWDGGCGGASAGAGAGAGGDGGAWVDPSDSANGAWDGARSAVRGAGPARPGQRKGPDGLGGSALASPLPVGILKRMGAETGGGGCWVPAAKARRTA